MDGRIKPVMRIRCGQGRRAKLPYKDHVRSYRIVLRLSPNICQAGRRNAEARAANSNPAKSVIEHLSLNGLLFRPSAQLPIPV
jgi:hypothetical protein